MKKIMLTALILGSTLFSVASATQRCVQNFKSSQFYFAFNDGDVHLLTFQTNAFNVTTATYGREGREIFFTNMLVDCVYQGPHSFISVYKNVASPSGATRHPVRIFIPINHLENGTIASVDLRWGRFANPKVFVK